MDAVKNFAYSTIATAPSPAASGLSLVVAAGQGTRFPAVPFNATIWPVGQIPTPANAEIVRVTAISTDTLTITRTQESTSARTVLVGDQIAATITAKTLTDISAASAGWTVISNTDTGAQNNWAPAGLSGNTLIEWNGASDIAITGLAGGVAGQLVTIKNVTAAKIATFAPLSGSSSSANQFSNYATVGNTPIANKGFITYQHDGTNWRILTHEQGASITPTYAGGDYTASTGSWTVDSGDVIGVSYYLRGKQLTVFINVNSTSVSATPVSLSRAIPGGFNGSAAGTLIDTHLSNPGGTFQLAQLNVAASGAAIVFYSSLSTAGTWGTTTNSTSVSCNITFEVK